MRLATFNLKHGATEDGYLGNPEAVALACKSLNADILALQEVDKGVLRSGYTDMARLAAEASGMKLVFEPTLQFVCGSYGNALLVKGDIDSGTIMMKGGHRFRVAMFGRHVRIKNEPRNAILATAYVDGREISVAATHLSPEKSANRRQLHVVNEALNNLPGPRVLMGDLNMSKHEVVNIITNVSSLKFADCPPSYPALNPSRHIDHIAVDGLRIVSAEVVKLDISDHLAVVVEVE